MPENIIADSHCRFCGVDVDNLEPNDIIQCKILIEDGEVIGFACPSCGDTKCLSCEESSS